MPTDAQQTVLLPEVEENRQGDYPVHSLFLNRWSSRAFEPKEVADETLYTILEAARWAPSSSNLQPWRFIVAKTEAQKQKFQSFIKPNNRLWTDHAPVLVLVLSHKLRQDGALNGAHAFDAGAAWASLAFQAHLLGLATRAVGGYDRDIAREVLSIPEDYDLHAVITLGYRGASERLPSELQERELPNGRRPLNESIIEGSF
ncbi:nitroreductase family protein [Paenibacillus chondroitinus]|uniref:Nitroreductase family protein n=1 Tax=Paenibacillus chondroitinus TaxID=59842 RepID=A0ABU6DKF8_9BACL|nr:MULTISPECIES: nitroreductase family protein [Paenibacillus]MCY9660602.1 nitroreductase family protein [Paenibacillus anseongense]MEB4798218.1 nitroreductase family protein [Paenibacillus chondroitinus]